MRRNNSVFLLLPICLLAVFGCSNQRNPSPTSPELSGRTAATVGDETTIRISGHVFIDPDLDGLRTPTEDSGIPMVVLDLIDAEGGVRSATTSPDGAFSFNVPGGAYTLSLDPGAHPGTFNDILADLFTATTPLSDPIITGPADSPGHDFGFSPDIDALTSALQSGGVNSPGYTALYWEEQLRAAIRRSDYPDGDYQGELLLGFLSQIESMALPWPYILLDGKIMQMALQILAEPVGDLENQLSRELLASEMNLAAGLGIRDASGLHDLLIAWGEGLLVDARSAENPRRTDDRPQAAKAAVSPIESALMIFGLMNPGGASSGYLIDGYAFVDPDSSGTRDTGEDSGIPLIAIELIDSASAVQTVITDDDGYFSFIVPIGDYTLNLDLLAYPLDFNGDLALLFNATTTLSRTMSVGPTSSYDNDFGFKPKTVDLIEDLEDGTIETPGLSAEFWEDELRAAIHDNPSPSGDYDAAVLMDFLAEIETLYLPEPFRFLDGKVMRMALQILAEPITTEQNELLKELLTSELNYVAGLWLTGEVDLHGVLLSWGEGLIVDANSAKALSPQKASTIDFSEAITLFRLMNTGGGGGVDE